MSIASRFGSVPQNKMYLLINVTTQFNAPSNEVTANNTTTANSTAKNIVSVVGIILVKKLFGLSLVTGTNNKALNTIAGIVIGNVKTNIDKNEQKIILRVTPILINKLGLQIFIVDVDFSVVIY